MVTIYIAVAILEATGILLAVIAIATEWCMEYHEVFAVLHVE